MSANPEWADTLLKEVKCKWEEWKKYMPCNSDGTQQGWDVFYSPISYNGLLILGINPGWNKSWDKNGHVFNGEDAMKIPATHQYFDVENTEVDYPVANNMRSIFRELNAENILKNSVKSNYYYFATRDKAELTKKSRNIQDFERCAEEWTQRLIDNITPRAILIEGVGNYNVISRLLSSRKNVKPKEHYEKANNIRLFVNQIASEIPVGGLIHPGKRHDKFFKSDQQTRTTIINNLRKFLSNSNVL